MKVMCFVLIERDNRFLMICEASKRCRGKWFLPGGKVNRGESMIEAARREVSEEAGCTVSLGEMFYMRQYATTFNDHLHVYFAGSTDCETIKIHSDRESLGAGWFSYDEIMNMPLRQNALEVINAYRSKKTFSHVANYSVLR